MWLSILIVFALVGGAALAIGGMGILGFPALLVAVVGLIAKLTGAFAGQGRTSDEPEDVGGGHKATGHAHGGQEHMAPSSQL